MHKKELVEALRRHVYGVDVGPRGLWRGQKPFALFLAEYLERLHISHDEKYEHWDIDNYLPELLVAAFETLRTSNEEWVVYYRQKYEQDTEHKVPNITDIEEGGMHVMLDRSLAVQTTLGGLMKDVIGEARGSWIESEIDKYCNAQVYVLQQTMDKFLRRVWWQGMYEMADKCKVPGMSGKFGETQLRTRIMAGRVMFTFARRKEGKTGIYLGGELVDTLPYQEDSVSFVADDSDPLALGTGLQSTDADFRTALDMIEDVIKVWPNNEKERKKVYRADRKISMI